MFFTGMSPDQITTEGLQQIMVMFFAAFDNISLDMHSFYTRRMSIDNYAQFGHTIEGFFPWKAHIRQFYHQLRVLPLYVLSGANA